MATFTCSLAMFVIIIFFVTSSDSGSLVIDIITSGGSLNPPVAQRIFWSCMEGAVAAALLLGGGLKALQAGSVATALPFTFVLLAFTYCLFKGLREDYSAAEQQEEKSAGKPVLVRE